VTQAATHNPGAKHTVIGSYDPGGLYINYAQNATTVVPGQGHCYHSLPSDVWNILRNDSVLYEAINTQFILNRVEAGSRFLLKLAEGATTKPFTSGVALEMQLLQNLGVHVHQLK
jgi:hypothetical protein